MPSGITPYVRVKSSEDSTMIVPGQLASTTTIGVNDILIYSDGTSQVVQAASSGNNVGAAGANLRLCLAHEVVEVTKSAGTLVKVRQVTPETLLVIPLSSGDTAATWNANYFGKRYELRRCTTTGYYTVDVSQTTNAKVEVVGYIVETKNDTCTYAICRPVP